MIVDTHRFEHLNLTDWPFRLLPPKVGDLKWAGRPELRAQVQGLTSQINEDPTSSLHLMWADFGAGKTHSLYYMISIAEQLDLFPLYVEWPKKTTSFVDVYRTVAQQFPLKRLSDLFWVSSNNLGVDRVIGEVYNISPDFAAVLERIYENDKNPLIHEWLRAQIGVTRRELSEIGVRSLIRTTDDAITMLTVLVKLVVDSSNGMKMLLMFDEFQRMDQLPPRIRRDVNTGIRTLFNACPESLSVILSFSFGKPDNIYFLLLEDVTTLADPEMINIPKMKEEEAVEFVRDLLRLYRIRDTDKAYFPFTEKSVSFIINGLTKLIPRRIMRRFGTVMRKASPDIREGKLSTISVQFVKQALLDMPKEED